MLCIGVISCKVITQNGKKVLLQEEVEGMEIEKGMGYGYSSGPQGFETPKALKGEADNLELMSGRVTRFHMDEAERGGGKRGEIVEERMWQGVRFETKIFMMIDYTSIGLMNLLCKQCIDFFLTGQT